MAFKSMVEFNEERYGNFFMLQNDGDSAQVIFLYRNLKDVLVAPAHYITSSDFKGYVHCLGKDCPACKPGPGRDRGLRVQNKLFVPLYNIDADEIQYFDRNDSFYAQLVSEVFRKYENPSECIFQIIRHGAYRDRNTRYEIRLLGKNDFLPYDEILNKFQTTMPEDYERVIHSVNAIDMAAYLNSYGESNSSEEYTSAADLPKYTPTPRVATPAPVASYEPPKMDSADLESIDEIDDNVEF